VYRSLLVLLCGLLLGNASVLANPSVENPSDKGVLSLAGPPWVPFLYENSPRKGLATEIVSEALSRAGYQLEISIKPWRRVLAEAEKGVVDVLIGLWFNEQRAKNFYYSEPYYLNKINFVTLKSQAFTYQSLNEIKTRTIGVRKGASFGSDFDQASYLNKVSTLNSMSMLKMLALGRFEIGIDDRLILSRLMQKEPDLSAQLSMIEPSYTERALHMAVVKSLPGHRTIVDAFNRELAKMKQQGRLKEIIDSYSK
jgi:polar amino acid transport system substrate-binding protein